MSPPPLTGPHGHNTRATLAALACAGVGEWVSTARLCAETACRSNELHPRLRVSLEHGWVEKQLRSPHRAEWRVTPAGRQALEGAMSVVHAHERGAARRKRRQVINTAYVPAPGSVAGRALAALEALPVGEWMTTRELAKAGGLPTNGMGSYLIIAIKNGLVEHELLSVNRARWRLKRATVVVDAAEQAECDQEDDVTLLRSSTWEPLRNTAAGRALAWLARQPVGTWAEPVQLGEAAGVDDAACMVQALVPAVRGGLLAQRPSRRDVRIPTYAMYRSEIERRRMRGAQ